MSRNGTPGSISRSAITTNPREPPMLKPLMNLAALGIVGVLLWKLLGLLLLPLVGVALGIFFLLFKFALIGAVLFFLVWLVRRGSKKEATV